MQRHGPQTIETRRLEAAASREVDWKRWGPYLAERQWGTVREDYSDRGTVWQYFTHDHARSRAYRWGEDGLLGICDRQGRLCFALALWNGRDAILKERLFGLTGKEGNHGEDVKECYYYLDSTPTHSYMKALYKYPQAAFPYEQLLNENERRSRNDPEFELTDTHIFDDHRYFDVTIEYAKASANDILIRIEVANRGPEAARVHVLPTLWFRNSWSWGRTGEGYWPKPRLSRTLSTSLRAGCGNGVRAEHASLGIFELRGDATVNGDPALLFTDNETNYERIFGVPNHSAFVKDAFHEAVVHGRADAVNAAHTGTKAALHYTLDVAAGGTSTLRLRLIDVANSLPAADWFGQAFEQQLQLRREEADHFYSTTIPAHVTGDARHVIRQAAAGLLWTKQFYHYVVKDWLDGDPTDPAPAAERASVRNQDWTHLYNRDVISVPDKWEYPWYAAWDLAFHMIPFSRLDPDFAKEQLVLFLREWYMHPSGQLPAYEWQLSDANPPVHAWAAWRVYKMTAAPGHRDHQFLARVFQKLLLNFTWWVNRKDVDGRHLFSGGFLGLDNIGVLNRSELPLGHRLQQADGTAWMAFYCSTMLSMALELAREDATYADMASKFFEHFVAIVDAMNTLGGNGLWDEADGFYYDQLSIDGHVTPMPIRSIVGLIPLCAVEVLDQRIIDSLPGFKKRLDWFLTNRPDLARHITCMATSAHDEPRRLLAIPSRERLVRVLRYMLDEQEFLSPFGIRSLSKIHQSHPFSLRFNGDDHRLEYTPGESTTGLFGGNSNWRGPIWLPPNFLLVEALERYHHFYGNAFTVECPTGSGRYLTLEQVAREISRRVASLFLRDASGHRPCLGSDARHAEDPHWRDLMQFHEYFQAETGRGCGASHQTGWTALAARFIAESPR
jgi:mannosylglycerate hydrolase MGH1-like protein/glycosyl hydrolase family 63